MRIPVMAALVSSLLGIIPGRATAQTGGVAVGYVSIPGRIGDLDSDRGPIVRAGLNLLSGRWARVGLEGGVARLNATERRLVRECVVPGGAIDDCVFTSRSRDLALSFGGIARIGRRTGSTNPYLVAGVGFMSTRTHLRERATTADGDELENFRIDGSSSDGALVGHLGAGLSIRRARSWAVEIEGRLSPVLHNYSGGLMTEWSPSLTVGIGLGR